MNPEEENEKRRKILMGMIFTGAVIFLLAGFIFTLERMYPDFFNKSSSADKTGNTGMYRQDVITYSEEDLNNAIKSLPPDLQEQILSSRKPAK
jgi:hypothetical protein